MLAKAQLKFSASPPLGSVSVPTSSMAVPVGSEREKASPGSTSLEAGAPLHAELFQTLSVTPPARAPGSAAPSSSSSRALS